MVNVGNRRTQVCQSNLKAWRTKKTSLSRTVRLRLFHVLECPTLSTAGRARGILPLSSNGSLCRIRPPCV